MTNSEKKSVGLLNWVEALFEETLYPELMMEKAPAEVTFVPFNFDSYKTA